MSSSSSSSSQDGDGGNGRGGGRGGDFEGPSSSRHRAGDSNWPEPIVEALASQVAIDAARSLGRLAAAPALVNLFQVCSTWRAVSRSDLLWMNLTRSVWNRHNLLHATWHDEYVFRHRTARNFRTSRYAYDTLPFVLSPDHDDNDDGGLSCRRLALSDQYLAAGFSDGSVRLFNLPSRIHHYTFRPLPRDRMGQFSRAVSGIILSDTRLVFASRHGDIHVALTNNAAPVRRSHMGDAFRDGVLVDFSGCSRWWVGLYAGVPDRAFHLRDADTEELLFVGGVLTNPESVMGWRLLVDVTEFVGRVRITSQESVVACTSLRVIVLDLANPGVVFCEEEILPGLIVGSVDACDAAFVIVDARGTASVRRANTLEELCGFNVSGASQRNVLGCMNPGYALMCAGGVIRAWEIDNGVYCYSFRERIGEATAMVADDRYVAASTSDTSVHLWDFGAQ
ncbi:transducin/WD40 repeat-like superfamily protein [Actinidia rufa]|uniref:Transducin/WD40 repeat-like superfamily protein n=1 Tax=Actinidia rufa TaxID=165716 RepID=A0A7J0G9Y3_9ERIC|nr:transducin/WD40 repeat-like superfamily protein [Actinidia rufa]